MSTLPSTAAPLAAALLPLTELRPKARARVVELSAPADDAVRLKSLGLCVGRRVEMIKAGDPMVVRGLGGRIGLSARLAQGVFVRPE